MKKSKAPWHWSHHTTNEPKTFLVCYYCCCFCFSYYIVIDHQQETNKCIDNAGIEEPGEISSKNQDENELPGHDEKVLSLGNLEDDVKSGPEFQSLRNLCLSATTKLIRRLFPSSIANIGNEQTSSSCSWLGRR